MKLSRNNILTKELVLIDGISRSGKFTLGNIISTFDRVEKTQYIESLEMISKIYGMGKISHDSSVALLRTLVDLQSYNTMISRNLNLRSNDGSSAFRVKHTLQNYIDRLGCDEGEPVLKRIEDNKPIFQSVTHNVMENVDILFDSFEERLKILYLIRHPIDVIYSWYRKHLDNRTGRDPLEFSLSLQTLDSRDSYIPLVMREWNDKELNLNNVDKITKMIECHTNYNMKSYNNLSNDRKERIMLVKFDNLLTDPIPVCMSISRHLGTNITTHTQNLLCIEKLPSNDPFKDREWKERILRKYISDEYSLVLDDLINKYVSL